MFNKHDGANTMTNESTNETHTEQPESECENVINSTKRTHTVRHKDGKTITIKNYTPKTAILLCCSECEGFESDPRKCTVKLCPLWPFRGYTLKNRARIDEEKKKLMGKELFKKNKESGALNERFVKKE